MRNNLLRMNIIHFLLTLQFFIAVLIPFFTQWGRLNYTQIFLLQSWFVFWIIVLEVPTGAIADRFGRKLSIALACFIWSLGVIVYSGISNFYIFMLAEFILAAGASLMSGADQAIIYDTLKTFKETETSKKVFARYSQFGLLSVIIAAPLGSYIASITDVRMPMLLSSMPTFLAGLLSLTLKETKIKTFTRLGYFETIRESLGFFKKHKTLKILTIDIAFVSMITYFIFWFYQIMLMNVGVDIFYFGIVRAGMGIFAMILLYNIERLEKWFGVKGMMFLSTIIPGVGFILAGFTNFLPLIILVIFLIIGSRQIREPIFSHYTNKYIPSSKRATVLSSISMIERLGIAIVNPFIGILTDWSFQYTLIIVGISAIIFALISKVYKLKLD